jgi:predicted RNA binding protein YcfA (HicA-like mRNA interferase family)
MTDIEKLICRFVTDPLHTTVNDCDRLLTAWGHSLHKKGGSHRTYHKKGDLPVNVITPRGKKYIMPGYVNFIVKRLGIRGEE